MKTYTVHAPPEERPDPERFAFVKDGFSWPALFVPILWILWHRLWLTLVWYVACLLALAWVGRLAGETSAVILALFAALLFALEANNIRRLSLARRGWREFGVGSGANLDEAEARFFQGWREAPPPPAAAWQAPAPPPPPARAAPPQVTVIRPGYRPAHTPDGEERVLGLVPETER